MPPAFCVLKSGRNWLLVAAVFFTVLFTFHMIARRGVTFEEN